MVLTKFDICNRALGMFGGGTIAAFTGSEAALTCANHYEMLVEEVLGSYPWDFCTSEINLGVKSAQAPLDPSRWTNAWNIPANVLAIRTVTLNGAPIDYERFENFIYCNAGDDDQPIMQATFRSAEDVWPPYFRAYFVAELAIALALDLTENAQIVDRLSQLMNRAFIKAKTMDSQGDTTSKIATSRFLLDRIR